jgi:hypothetical protein
MEKTLHIQNSEYKLKSSLFTIISYKNTFGTELFSDISVLDQLSQHNNLSALSTVIDVIFKITYILHKPFTKSSYDEFLQEFDFTILSNTIELETLANTIAELLGTIKEGNSTKK